ncbi:MAG: hypothetical protein JSU63_12510 [Phycisphaerales bacterium]|nr:MAG: hypothetical protein JSU63_12510 [Phycisphaerales bacterium]
MGATVPVEQINETVRLIKTSKPRSLTQGSFRAGTEAENGQKTAATNNLEEEKLALCE